MFSPCQSKFPLKSFQVETLGLSPENQGMTRESSTFPGLTPKPLYQALIPTSQNSGLKTDPSVPAPRTETGMTLTFSKAARSTWAWPVTSTTERGQRTQVESSQGKANSPLPAWPSCIPYPPTWFPRATREGSTQSSFQGSSSSCPPL